MSNNKYIFKRGGVFTFTFQLLNLDLNTPITDLTNIECSSSIETPTGRLIANLTVTPLGNGKLLFSSVGDTSGWATGDASYAVLLTKFIDQLKSAYNAVRSLFEGHS